MKLKRHGGFRANRNKRPRTNAWTDPNGLTAWMQRFVAFLEVKAYSDMTIKSREIALTRFIAWCGERSLTRPEEITKPILERYQRHIFHYRNPKSGKPWSFQTQMLHLVPIKMFFKWLTKNNVILSNPASELELPRTNNLVPRPVLTASEAEQVIAQPDAREVLGLRDRAILETLYSTAMRRKELGSLSVFDFDRARQTLLIREGKGGRSRVVPAGERAALWITKYLDEARPQLAIEPDDNTLFLSHFGEPMLLGTITDTVRKHISNANLGKTGSCHMFRHTAATLMLNHGADVRFVQQLLGHIQLSTTEIYTRISIDQLARIHALTHPGASLHFNPPERPREEGLRVAAEPMPTAAQIRADLDTEDDEDQDES